MSEVRILNKITHHLLLARKHMLDLCEKTGEPRDIKILDRERTKLNYMILEMIILTELKTKKEIELDNE